MFAHIYTSADHIPHEKPIGFGIDANWLLNGIPLPTGRWRAEGAPEATKSSCESRNDSLQTCHNFHE